jgi:hypothetical protein
VVFFFFFFLSFENYLQEVSTSWRFGVFLGLWGFLSVNVNVHSSDRRSSAVGFDEVSPDRRIHSAVVLDWLEFLSRFAVLVHQVSIVHRTRRRFSRALKRKKERKRASAIKNGPTKEEEEEQKSEDEEERRPYYQQTCATTEAMLS